MLYKIVESITFYNTYVVEAETGEEAIEIFKELFIPAEIKQTYDTPIIDSIEEVGDEIIPEYMINRKV